MAGIGKAAASDMPPGRSGTNAERALRHRPTPSVDDQLKRQPSEWVQNRCCVTRPVCLICRLPGEHDCRVPRHSRGFGTATDRYQARWSDPCVRQKKRRGCLMTCKEAIRRLEALEQEAAGSRVDDGEVAAAADRERLAHYLAR